MLISLFAIFIVFYRRVYRKQIHAPTASQKQHEKLCWSQGNLALSGLKVYSIELGVEYYEGWRKAGSIPFRVTTTR